MISTVTDMYMLFLDGIKKERISTVTPAYFNRIINEGMDEYYRLKSPEIERDQKRIDDLQGWRVVTDGVFKYNGVILSPIQAENIDPLSTAWGRNLFRVPIPSVNGQDVTIGSVVYPEYRRLLNVMFKIKYYGSDCFPDRAISDWIDPRVMRSNQRAVVKKNPFRRATEEKLYYEILDDYIRLDLGSSRSVGYQMRLEYIKYPKPIYYNQTSPELSVMCELQNDQVKEIIDISVRKYIERVSDPRYQTQMYEMGITSIGK